ncbi:MAG TPA: LPS export ABC transporter periplasmic protein LptC [Paludibacteraceae bacterium]|nr:LPS export ABC transporter periplasmic protein LptC [Paludibacteraceae bacterium]OPZ02491.1 MAG: Lipopolysaccharide-assembly, LptC-related [Bacteroidetes bacterium ADurb.BinA395]MBP8967035.1 LPS export ABC transporter periplasmic protein LptC [Paludibacteraceae bacterium]HOF98717.1 LPS export ABC transporter periplasmic protein LptC [Paludibacteraceae bacterium]HOJ65997.1 LPS export ABC transporter periplasmic protein LptC [Paludibacteraceae bacterium]
MFIVVMLFLSFACNRPTKPEIVQIESDPSLIPTLHATDITTVISDSGITRYRISAPQWDIYDKVPDPYWEFPYGIHLERFDMNLQVDANIHSKYARFFVNKKLWELKNDVKATNLKGELFETEQLFWDQNSQKIYSDSLIKVTQATQIINAIGFESDQSMNYYVFRNVKGIFPVDESKDTVPTSQSSNAGTPIRAMNAK